MPAGKKVISGQPLSIPADAYNSFIDAAADMRSRHNSNDVNKEPLTGQPTILIRNDSEHDVDRFGILGLGRSLILPENNLDEFQNQVSFSGVLPDTADHKNKFVILTEPVASGEIGRGLITGISLIHIQVDKDDHTHATIRTGITGLFSMKSSDLGLARILWREGGMGSQWAIVAIGGSGGGGGSTVQQFQIISTIFDDVWLCRTLDGETVGNTDIFVAKPYLLRRSPFHLTGQVRFGGISYEYSYQNVHRTAIRFNGVGGSEIQVIIPKIIPGDVIYASKISLNLAAFKKPFGEEPPEWLDDNRDGRAWARRFEQ